MLIIINKRNVKRILIFFIILTIAIGLFSAFNRKSLEEVASYSGQIKPIRQGSSECEFIAFTCNVDWGNEVIEDMLRILREKDVKITFFVTGRWVKNFPEIFKLIVNEGHEIGSHGYQHLDYSSLSFAENKKQIQEAELEIMKYTGIEPTLFAPPSGSFNEHTLEAAHKLGYKTILWSIDTIDWRQGSTSDLIKKRVLEKANHRGEIVLMHPMPETIHALAELIQELNDMGINVGGVGDLIFD